MPVDSSIVKYDWYLHVFLSMIINQVFCGKILLIFGLVLVIENCSSCIGQKMIDIWLFFGNRELIKFYREKYEWYLLDVYQLRNDYWVKYVLYLLEVFQLRNGQDWSGKIWVIVTWGFPIVSWYSFIVKNMCCICSRFFNWEMIKFYRAKYEW